MTCFTEISRYDDFFHDAYDAYRKNATILIVNFKDIINSTELIFISVRGKFISQQNDTMISNFG